MKINLSLIQNHPNIMWKSIIVFIIGVLSVITTMSMYLFPVILFV